MATGNIPDQHSIPTKNTRTESSHNVQAEYSEKSNEAGSSRDKYSYKKQVSPSKNSTKVSYKSSTVSDSSRTGSSNTTKKTSETGRTEQNSSSRNSRNFKGQYCYTESRNGYRNFDKRDDESRFKKWDYKDHRNRYKNSSYEATDQSLSQSSAEINNPSTFDSSSNFSESIPTGPNDPGSQDAMGSVVNGRYMRKTSVKSTVYKDGQSSVQNNVASDPHTRDIPSSGHGHRRETYYQGTRQKYDGRRYKNTSDFHDMGAMNQNAHYKRSHRNDFNTSTYPNSHYVSSKNYGKKDKYNHKLSDNDLRSKDELYTFDDMIQDDADSDGGKSSSHKDITKDVQFPTLTVVKEDPTQRDRLIEQLDKGECECMVCCEFMRARDQVWNCSACYHVFHLRCIKKWARSPTAVVLDCGWRCPACQNISEKVPYNYYCFCGKSKEPELNLHCTPHTCGEICGKERDDKNCTHHCNLLCHPGPCPACTATVTKACACGKTKKVVPCSQSSSIVCDLVCEKVLNCGIHKCPEPCHLGDCKPCSIIKTQKCFCSRNEREVTCDASTIGDKRYCCNMVCNKKLACNHHHCMSTCHMGPCSPCALLPYMVSSCPCGKHFLEELYIAFKAKKRALCIDPIPTCGEKCEKVLTCGPKGNPHKCNVDCHTEECPPCPLVTNIKCQCGSTSKEIQCIEASSFYVFQCEKRCNRRKDCGRHKCLNHCCTNKEHRCELICNKKLSCGTHQCQENCHAGKCPTCWNVSFDELRCHCGKSVLYPPIHCGTRPPECDQPCTRTHSCDHDVTHNCHSEQKCPPCTAFTVKWCFGHHEKRSHVPCFLDAISCGKPCNKPLPCGHHKCKVLCHLGPCLKDNPQCTQLCEKPRVCGHPCAMPCHDGDCPDTPCKAKINVSCPCGHRTEIATCSENGSSYRLMTVSLLATKMQDIKAGESVNISDLLSKKSKNNRLQCNEECAVLERNKRLAVALQIQNPDLSCKPGPPNYSEFLKDEARKNPKFAANVYDKFTELVQLAKQSKQKSRSYAFPPMNRDQRHVIHELAEFFGCETQSYDEEPVKNVVITAYRDKSWLPFISLLTVIQREMGLRKGPVPLISQNSMNKTSTQTTLLEKKEKPIDYFDFPG